MYTDAKHECCERAGRCIHLGETRECGFRKHLYDNPAMCQKPSFPTQLKAVSCRGSVQLLQCCYMIYWCILYTRWSIYSNVCVSCLKFLASWCNVYMPLSVTTILNHSHTCGLLYPKVHLFCFDYKALAFQACQNWLFRNIVLSTSLISATRLT